MYLIFNEILFFTYQINKDLKVDNTHIGKDARKWAFSDTTDGTVGCYSVLGSQFVNKYPNFNQQEVNLQI